MWPRPAGRRLESTKCTWPMRSRLAQVEAVRDRARAGADGRQRQPVVGKQLPQRIRIDLSRGWGEYLRGVEAQFAGLAAGGGQVVPEDERAAADLGHQTHSD